MKTKIPSEVFLKWRDSKEMLSIDFFSVALAKINIFPKAISNEIFILKMNIFL